MEDGRITYRDLYIQVRRMNLKHAHIFLALAPHLSVSSIKALGVSFFMCPVSYGIIRDIPYNICSRESLYR